jgi:hypothetical protein
MQYAIIVSANEEDLKEATGMEDTSVEGMIENEAGWMSQSGIGTHDVLQLPTDEDQPLVDEVIEDIRKQFQEGDITVLDELLKFIPVQYLKGSLPEEG